MQITQGVHRISTATAKPLHLYLITGHQRTLLIDSGMAQTPTEVIVPYLQSVGLTPDQITDCVITHADCDHCGGNHDLKGICPRCAIHVSKEDRPLIENPQVMMRDRYGAYEEDHGLAYDEPTKEWMNDAAGQAQAVNGVVQPGETFDLGDGRHLTAWPLPGHTHGHIMLWDPLERTAFIGDGVLDEGEYDVHGVLFAPPVYVTATGYLESIKTLQRLQPHRILRAHCDVIEGDEISKFLHRSWEWAQSAKGVVLQSVRLSPGVTLAEMVKTHQQTLGTFVNWLDLMYPFAAHCEEAVQMGRMRSMKLDGVTRYWLT